MKKLLIALFIILIPSVSLAQINVGGSLTKDPVGTCRVIKDGYWQQMPDGTWASPGDRLNTCQQNGSVWNFNSQYSNLPGQYQYNPSLANMENSEFLLMCILLGSVLPQSRCQAYNPSLSGGYLGSGQNYLNNYLQYPTAGRNYIAVGGENASIMIGSNDSGSFWKNALLGVGMGWLLNRLTS